MQEVQKNNNFLNLNNVPKILPSNSELLNFIFLEDAVWPHFIDYQLNSGVISHDIAVAVK
jgi:hypothetical protein